MKYEFIPPISPRIIARRLLGLHRNSAQIQYLCMHINGGEGLNGKGDRIDPATLPMGMQPLLILRRKENVPDGIVLRFIEARGQICKGQGVTVMTVEGRDSEVDSWCGEDVEKRKHVMRQTMTGCEDDVIITFDSTSQEDMTRAREMLILVAELGTL